MSGNNDFPDNARARAARDTSLTKREQEHFEKLLSLYCANLRGTHGYAESTVKMYRGCMTRVVRAIGRPPWSWRPRDVDLLLSAQAERGLTAGTQAWTVTVLRGFQNYVLNDIGLCNDTQGEFGVRPQPYITTDNSIPYRRGRKGKKRSKIVTPLTPEQCDLLLKEFQFQIEVARRQHSKSYQTLRRDYAITVLALAYGVRAEEIAGIELGHFLSDREHPLFGPFAILRVIGKGSKERSIRLYAPSAADVLRWYVEHVRPAFLTRHTRNPNLLFLSERGCALSKRSIVAAWRQWPRRQACACTFILTYCATPMLRQSRSQ